MRRIRDYSSSVAERGPPTVSDKGASNSLSYFISLKMDSASEAKNIYIISKERSKVFANMRANDREQLERVSRGTGTGEGFLSSPALML